MKNLAFMSDIHIDANQFTDKEFAVLHQVLRDNEVAHLHIAGDISNNFEQISRPFLDRLSDDFTVSYNLGNHDMLGLSETDIAQTDFQLQTFGNQQLLSLAGWYDYSFAPQYSLEESQTKKRLYWFDRKLSRPNSDPVITEQILATLDHKLAEMSGKKIVSLHFVPHSDFLVDHPFFHRFNAFLGSQRFHDLFVKHGVQHVIFGHLHRQQLPRTIDGVTYHTKPLGYRREWNLVEDFFDAFPQYQTLNTYRLSKRYNAIKNLPDLQTFQDQRLYQEFQDSLILFPIDEETLARK